MSDGKVFGCFKYGCFGCLLLIAVMVGFFLLLAAIEFSLEREEPREESIEVVRELPPPPAAPTYLIPDEPAIAEVLPLPEELALPSTPAPGRILLDVSMTELTIRPGPADQPIRVEGEYDVNHYDLIEELVTDEEGGWTYDLSFKSQGGVLGMLFRGGSPDRNRIDLTIPAGHPIEISGVVRMGDSETDLGGLWVRRVDVDYKMGDHLLEFRQPLPEPMAQLELDTSMGNFELHSVGNASPQVITVDHSMGEILVDLTGQWRGDATAELRFGMGSFRLRLPRGVRIVIERARVALGEKLIDAGDDEDLPPEAPTLRLNIAGNMGELEVDR